MNTRIRIRLLLLVLAVGLAVPCLARADTIQVGFVIYQNDIPPGVPPDANPGTNTFYFEWLVEPLVFTEATFSVTGIDANGSSVGAEASILPGLLDYRSALEGFSFLTTDSLTAATFQGVLAPGVLTLDGQTYSVAGQTITGEMAADSLGLWPFGLDDGGDSFVLEVQATPIAVPVPEGGPGTLGLTTWAILLAAAARRVRP